MGNRNEMGFFDHLEELRWRLLKALGSIFVLAIAVFIFSEDLLQAVIEPLRAIDAKVRLQYLSPQYIFVVRLELAMLGGLLLGIPVLIYQIWMFIAPGLTKKERRYAPWVIISFILCFSGGAAFSYFIVFPQALAFLMGMAVPGIDANIDIAKYISFFMRLILAFGIVFEMPVLAFILTKAGLLTPWFMRSYRSYAVVIIFVLAAILTPPDAITQVMLGVPLWLLYEVSIGISAFFLDPERKAEHAREIAEAKRKA
jgi:sec-independent protein translocase protein TatC